MNARDGIKNGHGLMTKAAELFRKGLSVRKAAAELDISKSQAQRLHVKLRNAGAPFGSVSPLDRGTAGQCSSSGDTLGESQKTTDEGAQTGGQDSMDSQTESGTPTAGGGPDVNSDRHPSETATPSRRRFIQWQRDPRTGLWHRLWPKDLLPLE